MTSPLDELNIIHTIFNSLDLQPELSNDSTSREDSIYTLWEHYICTAITTAIEKQEDINVDRVEASRAWEFVSALLTNLGSRLSLHPSWNYPLSYTVQVKDLLVIVTAFLDFFKSLIEIAKTLTRQIRSLGG